MGVPAHVHAAFEVRQRLHGDKADGDTSDWKRGEKGLRRREETGAIRREAEQIREDAGLGGARLWPQPRNLIQVRWKVHQNPGVSVPKRCGDKGCATAQGARPEDPTPGLDAPPRCPPKPPVVRAWLSGQRGGGKRRGRPLHSARGGGLASGVAVQQGARAGDPAPPPPPQDQQRPPAAAPVPSAEWGVRSHRLGVSEPG